MASLSPKEKKDLERKVSAWLLSQEGLRPEGGKVKMNVVYKNGFGIAKILFLIFGILFVAKVGQIGGFATASWWLITLPIWCLPALIVAVTAATLVVGFVVWLAYFAYETLAQRKARKLRLERARRQAEESRKRMTREPG